MKMFNWLFKRREKLAGLMTYIDPSYYEKAPQEVLYALQSANGKWLSLNPALDSFHEVDLISELNIWDYQEYEDENLWFMGNSARSKIPFQIRKVPPADVVKLR